MYSSALYAELRERTGLDPGWRGVGGLRLATTPERVEELRRQVERRDHVRAGHGPARPGRDRPHALPLLDVADVLAGRLAARRRLPATRRRWPRRSPPAPGRSASTLRPATRSTGIEVAGGAGPRGASTDRGRVATEIVVDAAGAAAGHVGGWPASPSRSCRSSTSTW